MSGKVEQPKDGKVVTLPAPRSRRRNLLYAVVAILVVGFCIYEIFRINYAPVKTEVALETTVENAVTVEGLVVRDESYIRADAAGTLVPLVTV